jgi:hypothetical protein
MFCLARMIWAQFRRGRLAVAYRSDRVPCSRRCMPSWHCIRLRACETEISAGEKVANCNWCSNLSKGFRANTRLGHETVQRREASMRPRIWRCQGSRKTDAVSNSSAVPPRARLNYSRASGRVRSSLLWSAPPKRALRISTLARRRIDYAVFRLSI